MAVYFDDRITLSEHGGPVCVYAGNRLIARSTASLRLSERGYPARFYLPLDTVAREHLQSSDKTTYCPYKGHTTYYHLQCDGVRHENAGWVYPQPRSEMAAIADHIAFDHPQLTLKVE